MKSRDFVYWLQGFSELAEPYQQLTQQQVNLIKTHLKLVEEYDLKKATNLDKLQEYCKAMADDLRDRTVISAYSLHSMKDYHNSIFEHIDAEYTVEENTVLDSIHFPYGTDEYGNMWKC
jgi:hypothetical protein